MTQPSLPSSLSLASPELADFVVRHANAAVDDVELTTAGDVEEGDFLVDLDNGYVHTEPSTEHGYVGEYNVRAFSGLLLIEFHDANGAECALFVPEDHPIRVRRGDA